MTFPVLNSLVELCVKHNVRNAVLCPGSRSAPLILAFARNKNIRSLTFSDERSAAFIALGMAQQTKAPVVLVCTSGSAAYNFAPAVAEAFFQHVPLIVITADRPAEWIDQLDGQTIHQPNLYGTHVKKYFELPHDFQHNDARWHAGRIINEALALASGPQKGPVHINAPFREPLYPQGTVDAAPVPWQAIQTFEAEATLSSDEWKTILNDLSQFKKILLVAGQLDNEPALRESVDRCRQQFNWPVAGDILSNLHGLPDFCAHADTFLGQLPSSDKKALVPDLLITFGKSLIAKNLKLFLRNNKPSAHWHIGIGPAADTFQSLTRVLQVSPTYFFTHVATQALRPQPDDFTIAWSEKESRARSAVNGFFESKQSGEFGLLSKVMKQLPADCNLHLANSMSVRYANHIGLNAEQRDINVYSNRGTSGIDGCTSTAVGHALTSTNNNVLITGDLAFFYDRNAFWHNYSIPNLFVVVLNNHGGIIFNLIDGPSSQPEAGEFFITKQNLTAKALASEFGFSYFDVGRVNFKEFFTQGEKTKILESDCTQAESKDVFNEFKKQIKKTYEA